MADDVELEQVDIDGVPGEWSFVAGSDCARVLLFFHGGGYCSGSIVSHRRMVTEAGRAGCVRTLAVGYRLAPEHQFPAALEDAMTAWRFLRRHGLVAERIGIGGDSAGAGLTLALLQTLRDAGEALPGCWSRPGPIWHCRARRLPRGMQSIRSSTEATWPNWPMPMSPWGWTGGTSGSRRSMPTSEGYHPC